MSGKNVLIKIVVMALLVTGLLSFEGRREIFCFHQSDIPAVKTNLPCSDASQPKLRRTDWSMSTSTNNLTTRPCNRDETIYQNDEKGFCLPVKPVVHRDTSRVL